VKRLFEAWYLIVAGRFWLRYSVDSGEHALWLISFEGERHARRERVAPQDVVIEERRWLSPWWDLTLEPTAAGFDHVTRLTRRVAKTHVHASQPAVLVSGRIGEHTLDGALGHGAHLEGTRRPDRFGWAHVALPGGRYVEVLAAEVPHLPRVALWATERRRCNSPLSLLRTRSELSPTRLTVGPFVAEADAADMIGVTYHDPDGTPLYCYHSERARLRGEDVSVDEAAFEYASREPVPGWPISL